MKINTISNMDEKEFEEHTQRIIDALGDEALGFFNAVYDTFKYFVDSDRIVKRIQISLDEFDIMTKRITKVLGKEDAERFFKSIYDALSKKTVKYLGVMVKVFEAFR